mmetsp:Transcript_22871/g.39127  ORF Transcript_22871/g.39127 Transcript_22871/m.39127 type:complete len:203 (+) Transcript_22871:288-896(+)
MFTSKPSKKPLLNAEIEDPNAALPKTRQPKREVAVGNEEEEEEGVRERKLGHKLFFCCCDTKRAVLWLNITFLLLNIFTFTAAIARKDVERAEGFTQGMIMRGCFMFVTFSTILGAWWYSKTIVLVGLIFTTYQLTVAVMKASKYDWNGGYNEDGELEVILSLIWNMLLFYAEGAFIWELNDGIITAETYKRRERYCCCFNC